MIVTLYFELEMLFLTNLFGVFMSKLFEVSKSLKIFIIIGATSLLLGMIPTAPEEGMYPLSEIDKVDLVKAGLKIEAKDVYNPNGTSLVDALVNLSGCTGSFISDQGLIITNHHCAYGSIAKASTVEKNYLENGFHAKSFEEEIPSQANTVRIIDSYEDVSVQVLDAVKNISDPLERVKVMGKKIKEIADAAVNEKESIVADVSEMFAGKTYILFKYRVIRDVRLVYAPTQSIGNFGGETDNWVWPRHTGDFSLLRAYVAPDGKAATYSKDNVPFKPKKFLKINPNGVEENDFVFILGYPGRTFRHRPADYIKYQQEYLLPFTYDINKFAIETMQEISEGNPTLKLAFASRIKGLANTMKNYYGKIQGLKKIDLVSQKYQEEKALQKFIESKPELKSKFGNLLQEIHFVYESINSNAQADLWLRQIQNYSPTLAMANFILTYSDEMQKPEAERSANFQEKNLKRTLEGRMGQLASYNAQFEEAMLTKLFTDANSFKKSSRIAAIDYLLEANGNNAEEALTDFIEKNILDSKILNKETVNSFLGKKPEEISAMQNPLFIFVNKLKQQMLVNEKESQKNDGRLNKLYADLVDVKMEWKKTNFIPDANSTLRLTYGYIRGYNPSDAVYHQPFTSIDGVMEKNATGEEDFVIPDKLRTIYNKKDFGSYFSKKQNKLPVAMLYNMDTTGGNSGSPILDAYGNLIGVNFDRAFGATINDFAWNEAYSRSIGVDVRYVLWVLDKFSGASNILKEIGI